VDQFGHCDICWNPAAMGNQFGRFCGLKCFRVWQGMPEAEALMDTVALASAVESELTRIWPDAERLGWSHGRIWNLHFWPNSNEHPRGLAAVLQPGDTITEVTETYITILAQGSHLLRFYKQQSPPPRERDPYASLRETDAFEDEV
jgi:hypothetical protein